jgi:hypothetical protein
MTAVLHWSEKDPQEIVTIGFELADILDTGETLLAVSVAAAVVSGTDPTPSAILFGAAEIDGSIVRQAVQAGVDATRYRLSFTIDTSLGNRYVEPAMLDVRQKD